MTEAERIRILIVDDHTLVREALGLLISGELDMQVVGQAGDGLEAVRQAELLQPDVILLDLMMPHKNGIEAMAEIKQVNPTTRILVLTSFVEDDKVFPAIKAGALGYLLKDSSSRELLEAIRDTYHGESWIHSAIARKLIRELNQPSELPPTENPLTEREAEVLKLVGQGLANQTIAERLAISERTVRAHVSSILTKLHLANRTQAALYAVREGFTNLEV